MTSKFILRFDDISPCMAWSKFMPLKNTIEQYNIKSLLGIVPKSFDEKLNIEEEREDFFDVVKGWMDFGDSIAQHGTHHVYNTKCGGILGINQRSEFAGNSYKDQLEKLKIGKQILEENKIWQPYFMAPSHSFDLLTIDALQELKFEAITDGYGFYPYKIKSLLLVPQLHSHPINNYFGITTICIHINSLPEIKIKKLINFIINNQKQFLSFDDVVKIGPVNNIIAPISRVLTKYALKGYRSFKFLK